MVEEVLTGLMTTGEVARLFNRDKQTVNVWRREKGLPFVRIPGDARDTIRYRRAAVLEWAALMSLDVRKERARL